MRPTPGGGLDALPMPPGEPSGIWAAAALLRAAAAAIGGASLAAGGGRLPVLAGWSGDAATAATTELALVAGLEAAMRDRLTRAAVVLSGYADELDAAQRSAATLQGAWDAALPADPLAVLPEVSLAALAGTYGVVSADLQLAADVAAHRLRALTGEVVAVDRPGRPVASALGWADPPPSEAAVRGAVLAGLPVVSGVVAHREAAALADLTARDLEAVAGGDVGAARPALARFGARSWDPVAAQALWARLDPLTAGRALEALARAGDGDAYTGLRVALGTALATAADPRHAAGLDAATRSRLDTWREPWLVALAASVAVPPPRPAGGAMSGAEVQGMLMTGARQAGLSPGTRYASTVAVAMVTADRALRSPTTVRPAAALTGARGPTDDPLLAVARALDHDAEAARAWLLAPLPGADGRLVVEQLVAGRYRSMDPGAAATSFAATAQLVTATGGDPARRDTVLLDAAFLGAVGSEALSTPEPDAYRAALAPALGDVGTVLARHPDAVTAVLDDSAGGGVDAGAVLDADRLTRPGRSPGTWEAVLPDRSTAAALVGVVALDTGALTDRSSGTAPREPAAAPALSQVLWALDTRLEADLVDAVRADRSGDPHALDAVARRLGETVGFTLTSAGEGLARRDADVDDRNRVLAGLAEAAAGKVVLPGAGRLATPLVRLAADRLVDATLPTDSAAAQRRATTQATENAADAANLEIRSLVSRAHPWTDEQSPQRWAAGRDGVRFWDDAGTPLPESAMTTAQRRAFTAWRREVGLSLYDTAPAVVRDGVEAGVRAAMRSAS